MKRLHIHIAFDDLAKSIGFYSTLFRPKAYHTMADVEIFSQPKEASGASCCTPKSGCC